MNSQCPRDLQRRCNTTDANTCCGGGCDEPCSCTVCHPTTVALPNAVRWCDEHIKTRETVSTLGFSEPLRVAVIAILRAYRKDCRAEIDRAEQVQEKVIVAMRDALKEVSRHAAVLEGNPEGDALLDRVEDALKLAGVTL